ncbi:uncharacterized protein LOC103251862 [Carlito syrichta]|uniref:Uncharacterized protein LOC103251862 n=1 Tax=Carlito syrichta TaxID=1868482 RepID=A0A1U7T485_CARSF|nr:uncharacterized protein LOC103251862 [Carlito syrichta]
METTGNNNSTPSGKIGAIPDKTLIALRANRILRGKGARREKSCLERAAQTLDIGVHRIYNPWVSVVRVRARSHFSPSCPNSAACTTGNILERSPQVPQLAVPPRGGRQARGRYFALTCAFVSFPCVSGGDISLTACAARPLGPRSCLPLPRKPGQRPAGRMSGTGARSSHLSQPVVKSVLVYRNGDPFFAGRRVVIHEKKVSSFDVFLKEVTGGVQAPFGAVRNIYTPRTGHRIRKLDQIQSGGNYVAGGQEAFKKLNYLDIGEIKKRPMEVVNTELPVIWLKTMGIFPAK